MYAYQAERRCTCPYTVIFIRHIQEQIENIMAEEEKATPHQPAHLET
jgi:hypothetical protein